MDSIPRQFYGSINHWSQNTPSMQVHPHSLDTGQQKRFPRSLSEVWQPRQKTLLHKGRRRRGGRGTLSTLAEGGGPDSECLMWYQQLDFSELSSPFSSNLFHLKLIFPQPQDSELAAMRAILCIHFQPSEVQSNWNNSLKVICETVNGHLPSSLL